jgi:small-conductance mechanosensitive channel
MVAEWHTLADAFPTLAGWLDVLLVALPAVMAAIVATQVAWVAAVRLARSRVFAATMLQFARWPTRLVAVLFALQIALAAAPDDLRGLLFVERGAALALTVAFAWLAMRCIAAVADAVIQRNPVDAADNLRARRVQTQTRVLARVANGLILFAGVALALMTFPAVRTIGTSLLASAGIAGLVVGIAARPALGNVIAGLQIALAQPIRIDDVVVIEGEWGRIEEIRGSYVVVRVWDERRLIVPLQWFIDHPFQNWTLTSAQIIGTVFVWADYHLPLAPLRAELERLCKESPEWDRRVCNLQVTDAGERSMQLRALVSSADSNLNWDLRCHVREGLISFMQARHADCLPRSRVQVEDPFVSTAKQGRSARSIREETR